MLESKWFLERSIISSLGKGEVVRGQSVDSFFLAKYFPFLCWLSVCLSVSLFVFSVCLSRSGVDFFLKSSFSSVCGVWLQAEGINNQAAFALAPVTRCPGGGEEP